MHIIPTSRLTLHSIFRYYVMDMTVHDHSVSCSRGVWNVASQAHALLPALLPTSPLPNFTTFPWFVCISGLFPFWFTDLLHWVVAAAQHNTTWKLFISDYSGIFNIWKMLHSKFAAIYIIYCHTKFHMPSCKYGPLVIIINRMLTQTPHGCHVALLHFWCLDVPTLTDHFTL
jgi:hypothetical protein